MTNVLVEKKPPEWTEPEGYETVWFTDWDVHVGNAEHEIAELTASGYLPLPVLSVNGVVWMGFIVQVHSGEET